MTKILFINGETDSYTALSIKDKIGIENFVKEVESHGGKFTFEDDEREIYGSAEILEFGEIDLKFIEFLFNGNFIDYDFSKHKDFHVID